MTAGEAFKAVKVTDNVFWVGAIDWALRDFHGYATSRGTTYNAFLIVADEVTLVDAVKAPFKNEMLSRISSVIDPSRISTIISNHSELDHTGCLFEVADLVAAEKIYASRMGVKALREHFNTSREIITANDGEEVDLGGIKAVFLETKMLHWPDSMFTYLPERKLLFSQDGFGMHLASSERFDDELDWGVMEWELSKYFANILLPYTGQIRKLLEKVGSAGLSFDMILPDHGPVLRKDIGKVIGLYDKWSKQEPGRKAVITYDTMWGSTDKMARAIADEISSHGIEVKVMPLGANHRSDVATELLEAGAFIVGSPTINNNMFPTVADCLTYIKGLKRKNLVGGVFGSYGWGGEAVKHVTEWLTSMDVDLAGEAVKAQYVPDEASLTQCRDLGRAVAEKLLARISAK